MGSIDPVEPPIAKPIRRSKTVKGRGMRCRKCLVAAPMINDTIKKKSPYRYPLSPEEAKTGRSKESVITRIGLRLDYTPKNTAR